MNEEKRQERKEQKKENQVIVPSKKPQRWVCITPCWMSSINKYFKPGTVIEFEPTQAMKYFLPVQEDAKG